MEIHSYVGRSGWWVARVALPAPDVMRHKIGFFISYTAAAGSVTNRRAAEIWCLRRQLWKSAAMLRAPGRSPVLRPQLWKTTAMPRSATHIFLTYHLTQFSMGHA
jgi:hypothetical protein